MIVISDSRATFSLNIESATQLEHIADSVFEIASAARREFFAQIEVEPHVWVEEGSTKVRARLLAAGKQLVLGLSILDGALGGFERLRDLGSHAAHYIAAQVPDLPAFRGSKVTHRMVSAGDFDKVHSLLEAVRTGALTPEEAQARIQMIFARPEDRLPPDTLLRVGAELERMTPTNPLPALPQFSVAADTRRIARNPLREMDEDIPATVARPSVPPPNPKGRRRPTLRVEVWESPSGNRRRRRFY